MTWLERLNNETGSLSEKDIKKAYELLRFARDFITSEALDHLDILIADYERLGLISRKEREIRIRKQITDWRSELASESKQTTGC